MKVQYSDQPTTKLRRSCSEVEDGTFIAHLATLHRRKSCTEDWILAPVREPDTASLPRCYGDHKILGDIVGSAVRQHLVYIIKYIPWKGQ